MAISGVRSGASMRRATPTSCARDSPTSIGSHWRLDRCAASCPRGASTTSTTGASTSRSCARMPRRGSRRWRMRRRNVGRRRVRVAAGLGARCAALRGTAGSSALRCDQTQLDLSALCECVPGLLLAGRWRYLAHAHAVESAQIDALVVHEISHDSVHALTRQLIVVPIAAARIGEALKLQDGVRVRLERLGDLRELIDGLIAEVSLVEVEVHHLCVDHGELVAIREALVEARLRFALGRRY